MQKKAGSPTSLKLSKPQGPFPTDAKRNCLTLAQGAGFFPDPSYIEWIILVGLDSLETSLGEQRRNVLVIVRVDVRLGRLKAPLAEASERAEKLLWVEIQDSDHASWAQRVVCGTDRVDDGLRRHFVEDKAQGDEVGRLGHLERINVPMDVVERKHAPLCVEFGDAQEMWTEIDPHAVLDAADACQQLLGGNSNRATHVKQRL
eukprot:CAMPEP_0119086674 /NCGR_PEP_ID=MMETSP1178-20130426/138973_1 /TAXON_ID=33656 /ORGANISM="unid sp, Strain CCMP2000" /LENGTH=202 /DNA_ID=CAMNT_0007069825 /DNA_START=98 /DNA_END=707 /DNA_ORIENTATION=+